MLVVVGDDVVVGDGCDGSVGAAVGIVVVGILLSDSTIIFAFKTHWLATVSENITDFTGDKKFLCT